jgi:hypothetical protein
VLPGLPVVATPLPQAERNNAVRMPALRANAEILNMNLSFQAPGAAALIFPDYTLYAICLSEAT